MPELLIKELWFDYATKERRKKLAPTQICGGGRGHGRCTIFFSQNTLLNKEKSSSSQSLITLSLPSPLLLFLRLPKVICIKENIFFH